MLTVATWLVHLATLYGLIGVVFAVAFVWKGAGRIDPAAGGGTWGFRVLIFPGAAALWPLLAGRWLGGSPMPPEEKNPHRRAAANRKQPS